ncbi:MAG: diguanylate cyclase [Frankiaceae bacterium]|nr:diguanylate cyclase [Frankiaceae bacterium]MDQ1699261.1 diguanylate cyclase [Frankiaceae bacterium]
MSRPETSARANAPRAVLPQRQLRAALKAAELVLHYQPVVSPRTGRVRGVEALLRWQHQPDLLLMPDDFLPAVTHTPVMHDLTTWVIGEACAQIARWDLGTMSVNVAAGDIVRPSLVTDIDAALTAHGLEPQRLVVELTEHAAVQGMSAAAKVLHDLRQLGVGVSLDDFGTGYSSLLYLRDLPVTEVKIDRVFVSGVDQHDDDAAIVHSVVQLAHSVGLSVVAEGVERTTQARFLADIGCDYVQGFLYAPPTPPTEVPRRIDQALLTDASAAGSPRRRPRNRGSRLTTTSPTTTNRIREMAREGASLHTIAAALNHDGLLTDAGTRWSAPTVARVLSTDL